MPVDIYYWVVVNIIVSLVKRGFTIHTNIHHHAVKEHLLL